MPLFRFHKGMSKKERRAVVARNIRIEARSHPGMPPKQRVAIAYHAAGERKGK